MNRNDKDYWLTDADFESIPADEIASGQLVKNPFVSVLMLAWNHAEFIAEAIESVVTQKCEFPFELIIGEDYSTDETLSICRTWQEKYPQVIRIVSTDKNVGMHHNFARIWHCSQSKYIAFCEGDDYWVESSKLQQQFEWFRQNPKSSLVGTFTDKIVQNSNGDWVVKGRSAPLEVKENYTLHDLLQNYSFHFSSVMIRKNAVRFPRWFWDVYCVDRPLYLLAAEKRGAGLLPIVTSRYRQHSGGVWSPRSPVSKGAASTGLFRNLEQHLGKKYVETCHQTLAAILWSYMSEAIDVGDWSAARKLFRQSLHENFTGLLRSRPRAVIVVFFRIYFPHVYSKMKRKPTVGVGA